MPQSPSVLVAVGAHEAPKVPNQKYKNILEHNGYVVETATIQDLAFHIRAKRP